MLLVRLLCVLLPLIVLVAAPQMDLQSLWEESSLTVVAREQRVLAIVGESVLAEVIKGLVGARVFLYPCHHFVEVSGGLGQRSPISRRFQGLLLFPLLFAGLDMDLNRCRSEFNAAIDGYRSTLTRDSRQLFC